MRNTAYCTLFNHRYLARGLVMYRSLKKHAPESRLYVFAFDQLTYEVLSTLSLPDLTVISLANFEDEALLAVKNERTAGEYCWTSTSSTILYVLNNFEEEACTYVDADLVFYAHPGQLLAEMPADASVLITEHRYTPVYDKSALSGRFCVQFVYFRKDEAGLRVLNWWRDACLAWCYNRFEEGKFGDQKYLDDWEVRFPGVHSLQHLGGGLAPWNIQQYTIEQKGKQLAGTEVKSQKKFAVVFYHFHGVKLFEGNRSIWAPKAYKLTSAIKNLFYIPYHQALMAENEFLQKHFPGHDFNGMASTSAYWKERLLQGNFEYIKRNILSVKA
jgi:hypothetical protein